MQLGFFETNSRLIQFILFVWLVVLHNNLWRITQSLLISLSCLATTRIVIQHIFLNYSTGTKTSWIKQSHWIFARRATDSVYYRFAQKFGASKRARFLFVQIKSYWKGMNWLWNCFVTTFGSLFKEYPPSIRKRLQRYFTQVQTN